MMRASMTFELYFSGLSLQIADVLNSIQTLHPIVEVYVFPCCTYGRMLVH